MIVYKTTKTFSTAALKNLLSVTDLDVPVGRFENALFHSSQCFSAWEENRLIGLLSALDDTMNAYVTCFIVDPTYKNPSCEDVQSRLFELYNHQYATYNKEVKAYRALSFYVSRGYRADSTGMVKNDLPSHDIISMREARRELEILERGSRNE